MRDELCELRNRPRLANLSLLGWSLNLEVTLATFELKLAS